MKKFDLLKVIGIAFAITILLSWVIPAGSYSTGAFVSSEATTPVGIYDAVRMPAITIATFIRYGVIFLAIGGFYGVLNKIGVFSKAVENISKAWDKKKKLALIMTIIGFALLNSLFALPTALFVLVPLFIAILLSLGYDKMTTFAATIGAMLVGQIGTIFGINVWGYLVLSIGLEMTSLIWVRIALFLVSTALYTLIVLKYSGLKKVKKTKKVTKKATKEDKKEEVVIKEEKIDIPLLEEHTTKKSTKPFITIIIIMLLVLVLGMYSWNYAFKITFFTDLFSKITSFKIGEYPILTNIFGSFSEFGTWGDYKYDLVVVLLMGSFLLGWIYNLKFNDVLDGFKNGMKKIAPIALYAMLVNVLFAFVLNMSGTFVATVVDKILGMTEGFNFGTTALMGVVSSFYYNDFYTLVSLFYSTLGAYDAAVLPIMALIITAIYGLVMIIAPTSVFLIAGLRYMEIPYKEWIKYIWKFTLIILAIILITAFLLTVL